MKKLLTTAAVLSMLATAASAASFSGSWNLSGSAFSDPGLVIEAAPTSGSGSFNLEVGESKTIDLFKIWTDESSLNWDDYWDQTLNAAFNLTTPSTSGVLAGTTTGSNWLAPHGSVEWSGPLNLNFGSGGSGLLQVSLSDETFNWGLFGGFGHHGATVEATFTYVVAPVPLPAAGFLLVGALGGLGLMRRRRKAA